MYLGLCMNYIGALHETFIKVHVWETDKPRFETRKCEIAANVLGACIRNIKFTFVYFRWESLASDSSMLCDALSNLNQMD